MIPVLAQTLRRPEPILGLAARVTWLSPASAAPGSRSTTQAEGGLGTQYSGILGCRGIYHKGWMASTFGPRVPWVRGLPAGIHDWIAYKDTWELYHLGEDWSQASDLAAEMPGKFAELKELFLIEATKAGAFPIGGGLWIPMLHPELRPAPPYTEWTFFGDTGPRARVLRPRPGHQAQRGRHRRGHSLSTPTACCTSWAGSPAASRASPRTA